MNKCQRCGNEVKAKNSGAATHEIGYQDLEGKWVHYGCSMLMESRPMPAGSLVELLARREAKR